MFTRKNVQNTANEHETCNSENTNEEEYAECIFCHETFLNSASGDRWVFCMSCSKWAHEKCAGVGPIINDDFICDFCSVYISPPSLRQTSSLAFIFL
jgi:hypothetical protein